MPRLVRDRLTWLLYLQLGAYGYFLYGINPSIPLLREEQDVSRTVGGLHSTAIAAGALVAGVLYAPLVGRFGRGRVLWGGLGGTCAGLLLYVGTTALPLTLSGALVAGIGGSFVVNGVSAALSDYQGPAGPAAVSEANACAAGLGLLAPLALGTSVGLGIGWRAALLVTVGLVLALAVSGRHVRFPEPSRTTGHTAAAVDAGRLPSRYWWAWGVLVLCIASEFSMAIWSSDVLRAHTGTSPAVASAAVTALITGMFVGRLAGARVSLRISPDLVMYGALALAVVGFGLFWAAPVSILAIGGLVVCGLGLALHFPVGIVRAIQASGGRTDLAAGRAGLSAALAIGAGPFALGTLADAVGPHAASLVVPSMLTAAAFCVYRSRVSTPVTVP